VITVTLWESRARRLDLYGALILADAWYQALEKCGTLILRMDALGGVDQMPEAEVDAVLEGLRGVQKLLRTYANEINVD